jgi:hydroxymethylpyrimidine pyrophosphatase-like HAD family hydrolase
MRYLALCTDYDGTIAHDGRVDAATLGALEELKASGRKLVLVTGREIEDLQRVFPRLELFDRVVAENGALIYRPATREERVIGEPPPAKFVEELRLRGVDNLSTGRCIVATWEPHERHVLAAIRDLGLELQVIFNKGAVMVLPSGLNKATGLKAALEELNISVHNTVGVGDAENDHAFLSICECSAAVANALPAVKEKADIVLQRDHGAGVQDLIREILDDDLAARGDVLHRHEVLLGKDPDGNALTLPPYGTSALIVGTSGGGKSTVAVGLVERLRAKGYGFCIIDPEGDYDTVEGAVVLGSPERAPSLDECMQLLCKLNENAVINLLGIKLVDRPAFFMTLFARIRELRATTGSPHWLIVDEAHHVLPADWQATNVSLPQRLDGTLLVSITPASIAPSVLRLVDSLIVIGDKPREMSQEFADAKQIAHPGISVDKVPEGSALVWRASLQQSPLLVELEPTKTERRRHLRKYAEGSLGDDRSFYFRGEEGKLNLRAHNLIVFTDLADGVDEGTWLHHWRRREISRWMRECIKDDALADKVAKIEREQPDDATESRRRVRELIEESYTLPAESAVTRAASGSRT